MPKNPDYSKMSFAELLLAFPGWPEGFEPERDRRPRRDVDFGDLEDEVTPRQAPKLAEGQEERKASPSKRQNRAPDQ